MQCAGALKSCESARSRGRKAGRVYLWLQKPIGEGNKARSEDWTPGPRDEQKKRAAKNK